jgi:hypothetical protein
VQPGAALEFYRDLTEISGYELETAGVLKEGRKFWALARIGKVLIPRHVANVHRTHVNVRRAVATFWWTAWRTEREGDSHRKEDVQTVADGTTLSAPGSCSCRRA